MTHLDVLILGGGLAGNLLARQLRRTLPALSVGLVEARTDPPRKVGESTVELGAHYLNRRLGLATHLYQEHLPKNGLRFFFDSAARDLPLAAQSEIGQSAFAFHPSYQVDRGRLDQRLLELNAAAGVRLWAGWRARGVELGRPHTAVLEREGHTERVTARWVVDASGRRRVLSRQLDLMTPTPEHAVSAAWCRVEGLAEVDAAGPEAWRARCHHSSRGLATVHLCQDRAWVWIIPLREGLTSVGWVGHSAGWSRELGSRAGLLAALRRTRALRELLTQAEAVDLGTLRQLSYGTRRFVSAERWALVGEAAAFTDPLYSPGTDHIAWHNDLVCDLIGRELGGEDIAAQAERVERLLQHLWRLSLDVYVGQYDNLASFDLWRLRYVYDVYNYFNQLSAYLRDEHLDPGWQERTLAHVPVAEAAHQEIGRLFHRLAAQVRAEGRLFESNEGGWDEGLFAWERQRGLRERGWDRAHRLRKRLYVGMRGLLLRALRDGWAGRGGTGWIRGQFAALGLEQDFPPAQPQGGAAPGG